MANDIADLLLRIDATTEGLRRELKKAEQAVGDGSAQIEKNTKKIDQSFDRMSDSVSKSLRLVGTALATLGIGLSVQSVTRYADAWQNATNQLKTVQKDTENLADTQSLLMSVANESRVGFETTANLYTRLSRSTESLNLTQTELIDLTETINKSFAVSGASATEASNAIIQLSQGLAAGALRGEEFNSVSEQSPILMQAIADSLKMTRGELRAFAAEGGITAEIVVKALQQSADGIDETFGKMTATFEQSMTVARNNLLEYVGSSEVVQRVTGSMGGAIVALSNNLDALSAVAVSAGVGLGAMGAVHLVKFVIAMERATAAQTAFNIVARANPYYLLAAGVGALTYAMIEYNKRTDESSEAVRRFIEQGNNFTAMAERMAAAQDRVRNATEEESKAIDEATDYVKGLFDELGIVVDNTTAATNETVRFTDTLDASGAAAELVKGKVGGLAGAVSKYGENVKFTLDPMDAHVKAMEDARREQEKLRDQYEKSRDSMDEMVVSLENELLALQMTARAAAVFEAVTRATADGALPAEIAKIAELTARVFDLKESKEQASQAADDMRKANEEAARVAAEAWGRTHEFLSDTFVDIFDEGGSAFEKVGDMAVATAKRIAAEWLALKAMNLFGIETPSGAGGGAASAITSILGQIGGKSAGNAVVSEIVKGGVGGLAGTVGATGTTAGLSSSIAGAIGAIPGWGWAIAAAAAAAAALSKKETPSGNAGFLLRPVGDGERQFDVPAFESGFDPVGFARREDQGAAVAVIDTFRQYDAALTGIARAVGLDVNYSANNFGGFNEKGQGGGTFFGSASEDGRPTSTPIEAQLTQFVGQWIKGLGGQVDQSLINDVLSAGSADEMVKRAAMIAGVDGSHESGLDFVPFDGYRAELHRGERVLTASENKEMSAMSGKMDALMMQVALYSRRMSQVIDDWDSRGLPPERAA